MRGDGQGHVHMEGEGPAAGWAVWVPGGLQRGGAVAEAAHARYVWPQMMALANLSHCPIEVKERERLGEELKKANAQIEVANTELTKANKIFSFVPCDVVSSSFDFFVLANSRCRSLHISGVKFCISSPASSISAGVGSGDAL